MYLETYLIHALDIHERRVFNRKEAASYAGVSAGHFDKLVKAGTLPGSIPGYGRARRWDKASLDRALNAIAGASISHTDKANAYDIWRSGRGQS